MSSTSSKVLINAGKISGKTVILESNWSDCTTTFLEFSTVEEVFDYVLSENLYIIDDKFMDFKYDKPAKVIKSSVFLELESTRTYDTPSVDIANSIAVKFNLLFKSRCRIFTKSKHLFKDIEPAGRTETKRIKKYDTFLRKSKSTRNIKVKKR